MLAESSFALSERQTALLEQLSSDLTQFALLWASGYLAGRASAALQRPVVVAPVPAIAAVAEPLRATVLYGSQTGNAKRIAEQLAGRLETTGAEVRLVRASAFKLRDLKKEKLLYLVVSTHSSGDLAEPPDDSREFCEQLFGARAPKLSELEYAVLALGDSSYPDFCGVGRAIDARLAELGGKRLFGHGEADVDIETVADPWFEQALEQARARQGEPAAAQPKGVVMPLHPARSTWHRGQPFAAEVLTNQRIVADDLDKDVRHIELSLAGSGIRYQAGDALGVWPTQQRALVDAVLAELGLDGEQPVTARDETRSLREWLTHHRELTLLTRPFIQAQAERSGDAALQALLGADQREALQQLLARVQLLDFLRTYPARWSADELVAALRPLAPRMYSIASSQAVVDEEVHITVARLAYRHGEEPRCGAASRFLAELEPGETAPVFVDANDRFRLPADDARDVIMIGPGTGVAPFRAFLQERVERGAAGRNWLFFGSRHLRSDFLYQTEWRQALGQGELTQLDVAFSRDQAHKVYVQDRIRERADALWAWLDGGAHVYVCGDAERMAPDVQQALLDVAQGAGGKSAEEAERWLTSLLSEGRYARDVY